MRRPSARRVTLTPTWYLQLRDADDLGTVKQRFETPILMMGDFNDEPFDRSVISHLQA